MRDGRHRWRGVPLGSSTFSGRETAGQVRKKKPTMPKGEGIREHNEVTTAKAQAQGPPKG